MNAESEARIEHIRSAFLFTTLSVNMLLCVTLVQQIKLAVESIKIYDARIDEFCQFELVHIIRTLIALEHKYRDENNQIIAK